MEIEDYGISFSYDLSGMYSNLDLLIEKMSNSKKKE